MRKIIIFICALLVFTSCCKSAEHHQATVTFTDGTTKVYKITRWLDSDDNNFKLMTIDGDLIYLSDVKEVSIKTLFNHKPQY